MDINPEELKKEMQNLRDDVGPREIARKAIMFAAEELQENNRARTLLVLVAEAIELRLEEELFNSIGTETKMGIMLAAIRKLAQNPDNSAELGQEINKLLNRDDKET